MNLIQHLSQTIHYDVQNDDMGKLGFASSDKSELDSFFLLEILDIRHG